MGILLGIALTELVVDHLGCRGQVQIGTQLDVVWNSHGVNVFGLIQCTTDLCISHLVTGVAAFGE
jgi:hypothetical protein